MITPARRTLAVAVVVALAAVVALAWFSRDASISRTGAGDDAREASRVEAELERIRALGYVEEVAVDPDPAARGVRLNVEGRASAGTNLFCSVRSTNVNLESLDGKRRHTIKLPDPGIGRDCMIKPTGQGDFLVLTDPRLTRIRADSEVVWVRDGEHHHDFDITSTGAIYTFTRHKGIIDWKGIDLPIIDHSIVELNADGTLQRTIPLHPFFASLVPAKRLAEIARLIRTGTKNQNRFIEAIDVFHPNGVVFVERQLGFAEPGQLLVCIRELDLLAVIDPDSERVVWSYGPGELDGPHNPSILPNGNVLVFDNGRKRGYSRILEIEPRSKEIVWRYEGTPPSAFWSHIRGSVQGLPNGNVLITESTKGHVFEVTRDGETVWDFWNPEFSGGKRLQIYRMTRHTLPEFE